MVYLIGGAGRSGKTTLALQLLRENSLPYFCTDFLMYGLGLSGSAGIDFDTDSFTAIRKKMFLPIWYLIQAILKNNHDYVVEGSHLEPDLINKLKTKFSDGIEACVLGYPEISLAEKVHAVDQFSDLNGNWLANYTVEYREKYVDGQIKFSKQLQLAAREFSIPFFDTGKRFEETLNAAIEQLTG